MPIATTSYFALSKSPRYSLTFALPLLLLYEVLAAGLSDATGGVRNGADVILRSAFTAVAGPRGPQIFGGVIVVIMLALIVRDRRRNPGGMRAGILAGMLTESAVLAAVFGVVVGVIATQLVGGLAGSGLAAGGALERLGVPAGVVLSLGAGLYEELLFRVLLVGGLFWVGKKVFAWGPAAAGTAAVLGGALVFSAFHYVGPFGDKLELGSFVFRAVAGLAFSGLYVTRGFGVVAWTHALYDVFLVIGRGSN